VQACQSCKKDFTVELDDFAFYEKMQVPPPTWCPKCRLVRRLIWRNDRYLSKVNCKLCGKSTFSTFRDDSGYEIYCVKCWVGDKWNRLDYGKEYDFSRTFFEQFGELIKKVPIRARFVTSDSLIKAHLPLKPNTLK